MFYENEKGEMCSEIFRHGSKSVVEKFKDDCIEKGSNFDNFSIIPDNNEFVLIASFKVTTMEEIEEFGKRKPEETTIDSNGILVKKYDVVKSKKNKEYKFVGVYNNLSYFASGNTSNEAIDKMLSYSSIVGFTSLSIFYKG